MIFTVPCKPDKLSEFQGVDPLHLREVFRGFARGDSFDGSRYQAEGEREGRPGYQSFSPDSVFHGISRIVLCKKKCDKDKYVSSSFTAF